LIGAGQGNRDGLSAYSVFNRGFQKLLGSVNEQELVMQHLGGGAALMGGGGAGMGHPVEHDEDIRDAPQPPPRQRRRPQPQAPPPAAAENGDIDNPQQPRPPPARRTGKKARRRDLEQRREMQRQRQAAADMGFQAEGAAVGQNNQEAMALQHLLQEQINAMEAVAADNDEPNDEARE